VFIRLTQKVGRPVIVNTDQIVSVEPDARRLSLSHGAAIDVDEKQWADLLHWLQVEDV
jgi:hypothetical protein